MSQASSEAVPTCLHGEARWTEDLARREPSSSTLEGAHLVSMSATFLRGQTVGAQAGSAGEEVATVLAGEFLIEAAGERYELTVGEGIVIPPGAERHWTCLAPQGALYRVVTRLTGEQARQAEEE